MKKNWNCHFLPTSRRWLKSYWLMRNFIILFFALNLSALANGLSQEVSLARYDNATLIEVFEDIKEQTGYGILYKIQDINPDIRVNMTVENSSVQEILSNVLEGTNLDYKVQDEVIVIFKAEIISQPKETSQQKEKKILKGTVTDEKGETLPGVSVVIKGTNYGVSTDINGNYSLKIPEEGGMLVFSFVGMITKEVTYSGQIMLNVLLQTDAEGLEEVVVIGYGSQSKKAVTGSISSVKASEIEKNAVGATSFGKALGGLIKGVQINQSGEPGSSVDINIRGYNSPFSGGTNQPLFVIDGVPFFTDAQFNEDGLNAFLTVPQSNPLTSIDPSNIESIDVLKDAAATSIYGSRGANGVIVVTTKRGKTGEKMVVDFSGTTTFGKPIGLTKAMNTAQFKNHTDLIFKNSVAAANAGQIDPFSLFGFTDGLLADLALDFGTFQYTYNGLNDDFFGSEDTNWAKEVYRSVAKTNQYSLNIRGGNGKSNYTFGGSFTDQEGLQIHDRYKQYNFNTSVNTQLNKIFKAGTTINLGSTSNKSATPMFGNSASGLALEARPDLGVRDELGNLIVQPSYMSGPYFQLLSPNPVAKLVNDNEISGYTLVGNAYLEAEVVKNLRIKGDINTGVFSSENNMFSPAKSFETAIVFPPMEAILFNSSVFTTNTIINLTANYGLSFDDHYFNFLLGYAWDRTKTKQSSHMYQGFPDDEVLTTITNANKVITQAGGEAESGINSVFARATYRFGNKYFATLNFRSDASSKFGPDNKRGYFPSLSLGWNMANEDFLKNDAIDNLKLRASVGRTGSANISDFAYLQFFETNGFYNGIQGVGVSSNLPNVDIGWETTDEINLGLDFSFFNQRLFGSIDAYSRKTNGALVASPFPLESGAANYTTNLMDITNKGIELELGGHILRSDKGINWTTSVNLAFNRNKLESLNGANINSGLADAYIEGQPLGTIKGYQVAGIFQSQDEINTLNAAAMTEHGTPYDQLGTAAGDYKMVDTNGDGHITEDDRVVIGDIEPDFFGGISNMLSYKGFELSAYFQFSVGAKSLWKNSYHAFRGDLTKNTLEVFHNNTWTPDNTSALYPRIVYSDPGRNMRVNGRNLYNTSYLRLKSLQLKYHFDKELTEKLGVNTLSAYVAASNLFTITNWPGVDPETATYGGIIGRQGNSNPYPLAKTISLGINVTF